MAPLTAAERTNAWRWYMYNKSRINEAFGALLKGDLETAIGEVDDYIDGGSKGPLKNAFSQPCKSELTDQQKQDMHDIVTLKRAGDEFYG